MFTSLSLAPSGVCVLGRVALSLCAPRPLSDLKIIVEVVVGLFLLRLYCEPQEFLSGLFRSLDPSGQPVWSAIHIKRPGIVGAVLVLFVFLAVELPTIGSIELLLPHMFDCLSSYSPTFGELVWISIGSIGLPNCLIVAVTKSYVCLDTHPRN